MDTQPLTELLRAAVPGASIDPIDPGDMPAIAVNREHLLDVCATLRDHPALQFAFLADVTAVDLYPANPRFEIVYHLACLGPHYVTAGAAAAAPPARLRMKVRLPAEDARIPSVTALYPTAAWPEREVFDLFGIAFEGHHDLRRILMPEDWEGHPLRKDYPVQIRKETASWSPLQLTPEEFARNIRESQARADRDARGKSDRRD